MVYINRLIDKGPSEERDPPVGVANRPITAANPTMCQGFLRSAIRIFPTRSYRAAIDWEDAQEGTRAFEGQRPRVRKGR